MKTKKAAKKTKAPDARKTSSGKGELSDAELEKATGGTIFRVNVERDEAVIVKKRDSWTPVAAEGKGSGPNPPPV